MRFTSLQIQNTLQKTKRWFLMEAGKTLQRSPE